MVSRKHRIVKDADFRRIFSRGRRKRFAYGEVFFLKNRCAYPRVAVVVSTRVSKKATIRNRLRRRVYEDFRHRLSTLDPGWDYVIRLTPASAIAPRKTFRTALQTLIQTLVPS